MDVSASNDGSHSARPADDVRARVWDMITAYRVSQVVRCAAAFSLAEHCQTNGRPPTLRASSRAIPMRRSDCFTPAPPWVC
jgi:hypothetical protein